MQKIASNGGYSYAIIKENYPQLAQLTTLGSDNKYLKSKKYAFICKTVCNDGSEFVGFIKYSNDLEYFQNEATGFVSWYNYPMNIKKNIQGFLSYIN
jgi:hypothetical protein